MTAPPTFRSTDPVHRLTITLNERVFRTLDGMAQKAGRTAAVQAQLLFDAAFSARCKPTGDAALDAAVAAIEDGARLTGPAGRDRLTVEPTSPGAEIAATATEENDHGCEAPAARPQPEPVHLETAPRGADGQDRGAGATARRGQCVAQTESCLSSQAPAAHEAPAAPPAPEGGTSPEAPAPAQLNDRPPISAATLKYMRMLKSIGNSPAEIADMVGLPEADVRGVLGGKR